MGSTYVEVLFDFVTCESDEISLLVGDIVQVTRRVDDNWLRGKLNGKEGNFPANHVRPLAIQPLQPGQKLFRATRNFPVEVEGDLGFHRDDLILGLQEIDANWWQGNRGAHFGIFPLTHVKDLDVKPEASESTGVVTEVAQDETSNNTGIGKAKALMDLTAQLDDELGFSEGDIIDIIEVLDSDFAIGQCRGQIGMFPLTFVEVIEGNINLSDAPKHEVPKAKFRWWEEEGSGETSTDYVDSTPVNADVRSTVDTVNTDVSNDSSSNHAVPDNIQVSNSEHVNNSLNEIKTKTGSLKKETKHRRSGSYTADNTRSHDAEITPYGKTLYQFLGENPTELSFSDNEIVTLYRHVDDQWMEGGIDGRRGLVPTAYIEIIVDCARTQLQETNAMIQNAATSRDDLTVNNNSAHEQPQDNDGDLSLPTTDQDANLASSTVSEPEVEMYGRVLYDFKPENQRDLDLQEGDTVTILRKVDEHWFEAKHDDGRVGFCPITYVEVIVSEPSPVCKSPNRLPSLTSSQEPRPESPSDTPFRKQRSQSLSCLAQTKPPLKPKPALKPKPVTKPSIVPRRSANASPTAAPATEKQQHQNSIMSKSYSLDTSTYELGGNEAKPALPSQPRRPHSEFFAGNDKLLSDSIWSRSIDGSIPEDREASLPESSSPLFLEGVSRSASSSPRLDSNGIARPRPVPSRSVPSPPTRPTPPAPKRLSISKRPPPPRPTGPCPAPATTKEPLILPPDRASFPLGAPPALHLVPTRPAPVPGRPAPPRPVPSQRRLSMIKKKKSGENLIDLSPDNSKDTPTKEALHELEKRLKQLQDDTQFYTKQKESLEEQLAGTTDSDEQMELQDNIEFCTANINGFQEEIKQVKEELYIMEPKLGEIEAAQKRKEEEELRQKEEQLRMQEEMRTKRREQRAKVLQELLQTEQDYLHSLHLCLETFLTSEIPKSPQIDFEVLFGNIVEVMAVSQKLLNSLKSGISGKDFNEQMSGESFVKLKEELKKTYAVYCRNHDDVIKLLEKYQENPEVEDYLNKMLDLMRQKAAVFDLESVLIKPVQRILKYPLLLDQINKSTDEDHPDKPDLLVAIRAMAELAAHINEYKRRKDLVMKYRQEADQTLSDKFGRLNVHSTKKKFTRVTRRMVGVSTIDEDFNKEERKFTNLDKAVRAVIKNIGTYLEDLQEAVGSQESVANDIIDYYGDHASVKDVEQFAYVHNNIAAQFFREFRSAIEALVINPLSSLLLMFQGPSKVIKKRTDKLLDYESFASKTKGLEAGPQLRALNADLQAAKNNYEALNAQLLDELPKLYVLSLEVVQDSIGRLIYLQQKFLTKTLEQMYKLLSLPLILGVDDSSIVDAFSISHTAVVDKLSDLCFIPKTFNPNIDEKAARGKRLSMGFRAGSVEDSGLSQSDSQCVFVKQQYPPSKIFQLVQDSPITQMMDLALPQGTVVGVIKEGDPMGNKDRWFVDNGAQKGFVLKRYLTPIQASQASTPLPTATNSLIRRSVSPARPSISPIPPEELSVKGTSAQKLSNLMDLSSPEPPGPIKATPIPADLDFSMASIASSAEQPSTWYEQSFWDEATSSPPSILKGDDSRTSVCSTRTPGGAEGNHRVPDSMAPHPKAVEAESIGNLDDQQDMEDLPPDYHDVAHVDNQADYYQAVYPFSARSAVETSLEAGEIVRVVQAQDLDGNSEWWLVEAKAGQGYAPANYLYKVQ